MTYPHSCTPQYCECQIIELHHKIKGLEADLSMKVQEAHVLWEDREAVRERNRLLEAELNNYEQVEYVKQTKARIADLEAENAKLKDTCAGYAAKCRHLRGENAELEAEVERLKDELAREKREHFSWVDANIILHGEKSDLEEEVERLKRQVRRLSHCREDYLDEIGSERDRHLATLKRVEWCIPDIISGKLYELCPTCGRDKKVGHDKDCHIAADIKRLEGGGNERTQLHTRQTEESHT